MTVIYRERDVKKRQRQAFIDGAEWGRRHQQCSYVDSALDDEAANRYPLPKVTRPRVVQDRTGPSGLAEWRVVDGCLEWRRGPANQWKRAHDNDFGMYINAERVKMLADLLATPNETVEDA